MDKINRKVVILTDSRGKGLEEILNKSPYIDYVVKPRGGHAIMQVTLKGLKLIENEKPSLVVIFSGITQITKVIKTCTPWKIILKPKSIRSHVNDFLDDVDLSKTTIRDHCRDKGITTPKIVFSTIPGADMAKFNKSSTTDHEQDKLNTIIEYINRGIISYNSRSADLFTPFCAKFCHRYKKGRYTNVYKCLKDGLHGNQKVREQWANEIHFTCIKTLGLSEYIAPQDIKIEINNSGKENSDTDSEYEYDSNTELDY